MKSYKLNNNGPLVNIGDMITFPGETPGVSLTVTITEETIPLLLQKGMLLEVPDRNLIMDETSQDGVSYNIAQKKLIFSNDPYWYLKGILNRGAQRYCDCPECQGDPLTEEDVREIAGEFYAAYPGMIGSLLIRAVALELDKQYKDHISNAKEIYVLSTTQNYKICGPSTPKLVTSWDKFAAFRNVSDAAIAKMLVKKLLNDLESEN